MGEEVRMTEYQSNGEDRVSEWEFGLPSADDLMPLSQPLIPPELASAFSISPEPSRSTIDVNRASQTTLSSLRGQSQGLSSFGFKSFGEDRGRDAMVEEGEDTDLTREGSDSRKFRRIEEEVEAEADSALRSEIGGNEDASGAAARTLRRPRLVWTPQLHKRFVDVVAHLGIKNAVPKTIMQLMNVEGLTRENVASHLQKYRLYLKRMQGLSSDGPSPSDHLFASTPVPQSLRESGGGGRGGHGHSSVHGQVLMPVPMPYPPLMMPVPMLGMTHGHGHMGMPVGNPAAAPVPYHGFESNSYSMVQQRDWSGNNFSHHQFTPSEK